MFFPGQCFDCDSYACSGECQPRRVSGWVPSSTGPYQTNSPETVTGSKANRKNVRPLGDCTIKSSPDSTEQSDLHTCEEQLEMAIGRSRARMQQMPTSTRMTPLSPIPDSSWVERLCEETSPPTGTPSKHSQNKETSNLFQQTFIFGLAHLTVDIIEHSKSSLRTVWKSLQLCEPLMFFGVEPEQEKVSEPGRRQVYRLTLKIHAPNGGAVIRAKNMLSLMNFEEVLTYPTCYDGSIATLSVWSSKVVLNLSYVQRYGLPAIWLQKLGSQN